MENELMHWGILGMRWGVRRYQNKDGTLTPAGKKRLREQEKNKQQNTSPAKKLKKEDILKQRVKEMSTEELIEKYNRAKMESLYIETINKLNPKKKSFTQEFLESLRSKAINELADLSAKQARAYLEKTLNIKVNNKKS